MHFPLWPTANEFFLQPNVSYYCLKWYLIVHDTPKRTELAYVQYDVRSELVKM